MHTITKSTISLVSKLYLIIEQTENVQSELFVLITITKKLYDYQIKWNLAYTSRSTSSWYQSGLPSFTCEAQMATRTPHHSKCCPRVWLENSLWIETYFIKHHNGKISKNSFPFPFPSDGTSKGHFLSVHQTRFRFSSRRCFFFYLLSTLIDHHANRDGSM